MKKSTKKVIGGSCACALVAAFAAAGTLAYLTDNESHTNTFTVGQVMIDLTETNWDETDENNDGVPDEAEDLVPNQEVEKNPQVTNEGDNDSIVFMRVTVPVKDVTLVADDGTISEHQAQEIFYLKDSDDEITAHANNFGDNWIELNGAGGFLTKLVDGVAPEGFTADENSKEQYYTQTVTADGVKDEAGQRTYVFGYKTRLAKGETTEALFDKVQLKNILENEIAPEQIQNIKIESFAIQADNILNEEGIIDTSDLTAGMTQAQLAEIYDIFVKQNGQIRENGDMLWDQYQDANHGQVEKEADNNNLLDLRSADETTATADKWMLGDAEYATEEAAKLAAQAAGRPESDVVFVPGEAAAPAFIGTELKVAIDRSDLLMTPQADGTYVPANTGALTISLPKVADGDYVVSVESLDPAVATVSGFTAPASEDQITAAKTAAKGGTIGGITVTPVAIGDTTVLVTMNSGAKAAVHVSVQRDHRLVSGQVEANDASSEHNGTSEPAQP